MMMGFSTNKKGGLLSLVLTAVILAIVFGSMLYTSATEPGVTVGDGVLKVRTPLYGVSLPLAEITDIKLKDEGPDVTNRSNGIGLGSINRGWFDVAGMGNGRLYIHTDSKPYIYILQKNSFIIINFKDSGKTREVYDELLANWKK